ncbi:hypothetical protein QBC41DRAFT_319089 [Cercophora samala]|uniref:C2H2-type domain-containing protein n=1 Tax=Cercophora samala TaxID=330535 RepID=A0AA39ZEU3_9PEZI|nr:hypothetical protein QBC41DRAFT_319089 [Cercophora samala]
MGVFAKRSMAKTRRRRRDLDQIASDIASPRHLELFKETKDVEDLPGLGQHYCIPCAKWFDTETNLTSHKKGKPHRRQLKQLKDGAFTHKEANAASGLGVDNGPVKPKMDMEIDMA